MTDKKAKTVDKVAKIYSKLSEYNQGYLLGRMDQAYMDKTKNKQKQPKKSAS